MYGPRASTVLDSMAILGRTLWSEGTPEEAEVLLHDVLSRRREELDDGAKETICCMVASSSKLDLEHQSEEKEALL